MMKDNEKKLRRFVTGNPVKANILLSLKISFDLTVQVLLVYIINLLFFENQTIKNVYPVLTSMFVLFVLKNVCSYASVKIAHDKAYATLTRVRLKIIERLKKLHLGFFQEHNTGELSNIIEHDVEQIETYLAHGLPEIMSAVLLPILIFISMLFVDWRLALIMLLGVPLMFAVKTVSQKTMEKNFELYFNHENKMRSELMEYVKNIALVKAFAKEETVSGRTLQTAREYVTNVKKTMASVAVPMGLIDIFMESGVVAVMIFGCMLMIHNEIGTSRFILSVILSSAFTQAISKTATLQHFSVMFEQALKSIAIVLNAPLAQNKTDTPLLPGDIEYRNVCFEYKRDGFKLDNINLTIKKNTLTAFVGSSGCGKTTLANLLMGFWDMQSGSIYIGGKDIFCCTQKSISDLIASVQQDVVLFNMSIFDNIALGKQDASKEEVINAAKEAQCHDFILSLANGYDTIVGEMGSRLSGGEKQRISIARMILKNAPIVILDEAMAAVDSENETLIQKAIEHLSKGKTVITIAHHLNTVRNADTIVVMDKGKIIGTGKHEVLINTCACYKAMVTAQNKVDEWKIA